MGANPPLVHAARITMIVPRRRESLTTRPLSRHGFIRPLRTATITYYFRCTNRFACIHRVHISLPVVNSFYLQTWCQDAFLNRQRGRVDSYVDGKI